MSARCKHQQSELVDINGTHWPVWNIPALPFHRECSACGVWMSIGPSNDMPPQVKIEIRAAELAFASTRQRWAPAYLGGAAPLEYEGWMSVFTWPASNADPKFLAGYLGRLIKLSDEFVVVGTVHP